MPKSSKKIEMYSPEWNQWITEKHLRAVNRLNELAEGFLSFGDVGKAAAVEMKHVVDILNESPSKKED